MCIKTGIPAKFDCQTLPELDIFLYLSEIKRALGISGVYSEVSVWMQKGEDGKRGAQIDMLIILH